MMRPVSAAALILCLMVTLSTATEWTSEQQQIIAAYDALSAATAPGGGGADAYGAVLAAGFTRWTLGGDAIETREQLIEGVRGWWTDGWRVIDRETDYREITIHDDLAFVRRVVSETYRGPEGDESGSRTALSETWIRSDGNWLLLRVNARPLEQ